MALLNVYLHSETNDTSHNYYDYEITISNCSILTIENQNNYNIYVFRITSLEHVNT